MIAFPMPVTMNLHCPTTASPFGGDHHRGESRAVHGMPGDLGLKAYWAKKSSRPFSLLTMICLAATVCSGSVGCGTHRSEPAPSSPDSGASQAEIKQVQTVEYVGISRCGECHHERTEEFRKTRHYLACVEATAVPMPAGFEAGRNSYSSIYPDLHFEMTRENEQYFMSAVRPAAQGAQRTTSRIDLVYGHGAGTDEAYFSWRDGHVFELPMVWLHPQEAWAATTISPFADGDCSRPLTAQCLHCHNTWIDRSPGSPETFRRETALLGVTCERCHGPGREHVAYHEQHPKDRDGKAIVHPGSLSRERLLDLCAQCHDNAIQFRRPPFTYQPGEVLSVFFRVPKYELIEDNHVANQNGGMQASRCFQQSDTLTCVTCHDPHHERSSENAGAVSCAKCHTATDCREHERLPVDIQGKCIACHMPESNKVQVNFRTEREAFVAPVKRWEHKIAVYPEARDAVLLEWLKSHSDAASAVKADALTRSLGEFWRQRGANYQKQYRFLMAIDAYREAERFESKPESQHAIQELVDIQTSLLDDWFQATHDIDQGRHHEAIALLEKVLSVNPKMARAHGRLGTLYAATGDRDRGIRHLQISTELDPNDGYGHGMLGWLAYLDNRNEEALRHFQTATELEPMNPKLRYQLGLTLAALGRLEDAASAFREVLVNAPDHVDACHALAQILLEQDQSLEAVKVARRLVEIWHGKNAESLMLLSDCHLKAGQWNEASQAAKRALNIANDPKSPVARRAQRRLEVLKSRTDVSR